MDDREMATVMGLLQSSFPGQELSEAQVQPWRETLTRCQSAQAAVDAVRALRMDVDWLPSHHQFIEAYDREVARHTERQLGPGSVPTTCRCEGSGWLLDDELNGSVTARRCSCVRDLPRSEHKRSCTCLSCHYGARGAELIRAGKHRAGMR